MENKYLYWFGVILGAIGFTMIWYCVNWQAAVALVMMLWGNNIDQKYGTKI